jgi:stress response protein YsnF
MLIKAKTLKGYKLDSIDGEIGKVKEFYFDDKHWAIRYLVADTGTWLTDNQVLLSPYVLVSVNKEEENIGVNLTKKQIENSPPLESHKPVSKQFEEELQGYYRWPTYWGGSDMWGDYPNIVHDSNEWKESGQNKKTWDPNLHSSNFVTGQNIEATDGELGHVDDFIIDDETWAIRYLVIDTASWWVGKKVLVSPQWIDHVSWEDNKVFVNLSRESIKQSPEYSEENLLTRDYETQLHRYYNRNVYWKDQAGRHWK